MNEWLSQQQGSVSKADIQKFLKENRVQIVEVVKGGFDDGEVASWWNDEGGANEEKPFDELTESEKRNARERYKDEVDDYSDNTTKFSNYQLAGEKENYKEVLVTMPKKVGKGFVERNEDGTYSIRKVDGTLTSKRWSDLEVDDYDPREVAS